MKMRFLVLLVCVTVAAIGLHAHGGEEHVMGTVTKVTDAAIVVKTAKGSATVAVASTTKFIKGKAAAKVSDLNVGDRAAYLQANPGRVVQLRLQYAHRGILLHGVQYHHGRRPAADLEEGQRQRPVAPRCRTLAQTMPRFFIS